MFLTKAELENGLGNILESPKDDGAVEMIVARPRVNERIVVQQAQLDPTEGLIGDNWKTRGSSMTPDKSPHPEMQLTIMNSRFIGLIAGNKTRWPLAGDQLYVDFDLSDTNLPPGSHLLIGTAIVEVTSTPHLGCKKFADRYGVEAMKFANSPEGKKLHLRGINTKIIKAGIVKVGDVVRLA